MFPRKKSVGMIGILDFNYACGFGYFVLLVMSFGGVIIRLFKCFVINFKLVLILL